MIEYLFRSGALDCVGRSPQFERLYLPAGDLTAAALADTAGPGPDPAPAINELVRRAARAHGVADLATLADHFRLRVGEARPAVQELLAEGELEPVAVAHPRGVLVVRGVHAEPLPHLGPRLRTPQEAVLEALAGELSRAARWQVEGIEVARGSGGGELAAPLAELLAARAG